MTSIGSFGTVGPLHHPPHPSGPLWVGPGRPDLSPCREYSEVPVLTLGPHEWTVFPWSPGRSYTRLRGDLKEERLAGGVREATPTPGFRCPRETL